MQSTPESLSEVTPYVGGREGVKPIEAPSYWPLAFLTADFRDPDYALIVEKFVEHRIEDRW